MYVILHVPLIQITNPTKNQRPGRVHRMLMIQVYDLLLESEFVSDGILLVSASVMCTCVKVPRVRLLFSLAVYRNVMSSV